MKSRIATCLIDAVPRMRPAVRRLATQALVSLGVSAVAALTCALAAKKGEPARACAAEALAAIVPSLDKYARVNLFFNAMTGLARSVGHSSHKAVSGLIIALRLALDQDTRSERSQKQE
jgi:hypothetical protein